MTGNIIIFGISGQDGFYLKRLCESKGFEVIGISRSAGDWVQGSVTDKELVSDLIKKHQPYCVFHFAANSSTRHDIIYENNETICKGNIHILEAVHQYSRQSKVFLSGSGLQFVNKGIPVKETDEFFAGSPYAAQRIYTTYLARYYRTLGVQAYLGYFFHHDSPLRADRHLNIKIINAALGIKAGRKEFIELGNVNVVKEYNHAADMMNAVWLLIGQDQVYETVIGTGKGYRIQDWIDVCSMLTGVSLNDYIIINEGFKAEFDLLTADPSTIYKLGWEPRYDIYQLAQDIIDSKNKIDK
jgi:GDPmannose 4,6-dehydratase